MHFADPAYFALLALVPLLHRWWASRNRPAKVAFPLQIPRGAAGMNPLRYLLILKYLGFALVVFAMARPQASYTMTERTVSGIDIMMLLDLSASMSIEDLGERSRLDIAKETMENFIKGRQNDRIGFVAFSGEPITLAPPTLDYGLVLKALHEAKLNWLKDGTAIGDGLSLAVSHLRNSKAKSKVIVLLTDGDNNLGQVDPATAGELAHGYGIRVYTIAIGREGQVKMPLRSKDAFGNTYTAYQWFDNALNPELLQEIAKLTGGRFYRVTDENTLTSVFKEIDQLEKTQVKTNEKVRYEERFQRPLKLGLFALAAERVLAWGWWRVLP